MKAGFLRKVLVWVLGVSIPLAPVFAEKSKRVYLVYDSSLANHHDPRLEIFQDIREALKLKQVELSVTDLLNEKDHRELSYVVVWNHPPSPVPQALSRFPLKKMILFMMDSPVIKKNLYSREFLSQFKRIYTWDDELVDNKKFFKVYCPALIPMLSPLPSFEEKKLLVQIASQKRSRHKQELYSARLNVMDFFQNHPKGEFEFYGYGWEQEPYYCHWQGICQDKLETLKNYRFSVCYENMCDVKGYITGKIFRSFAAGTVPIYWGASNITDFIPKECFIDRRDFDSFDEVYNYIKNMDAATYEAYLQKIRTFLASDKAKLFSQEMFAVTFLEAIRFP